MNEGNGTEPEGKKCHEAESVIKTRSGVIHPGSNTLTATGIPSGTGIPSDAAVSWSRDVRGDARNGESCLRGARTSTRPEDPLECCRARKKTSTRLVLKQRGGSWKKVSHGDYVYDVIVYNSMLCPRSNLVAAETVDPP